MRNIAFAVTLLLPWPIRRALLQIIFGYSIHPTSRIGFAWLAPRRLILEEHSRVGHLTLCKGMDLVHLKAYATIGRLNWITAYPSGSTEFFRAERERRPELILGAHAAITNRHLIDCTSKVTVGEFTTVGGFGSQILTHSIDLESCRQASRPIQIGRYCFVGTDCVLLGGCTLPDFSVLGAKSLLTKTYSDSHYLYAGTPARPIKRISDEASYFLRRVGVVH